MKLRSRVWRPRPRPLLLLALPVQAQDGGSTVTFDGVGFTFDATLGTSVNITRVRRPGPGPGERSRRRMPGTSCSHSMERRNEFAKVPRVGDAPGVVRVYRTADLAGYELASQRLEQLRTMLADRPDLATFMAVGPDGFGDELPFLPVPGAGQASAHGRSTSTRRRCAVSRTSWHSARTCIRSRRTTSGTRSRESAPTAPGSCR